MATKLRQVSKEEFEVLTIFHPGEVRYYVDIDTTINRHRGAAVTVSQKPVSTKSKSKTARSDTGTVRGSSNRAVQLTTKRIEFKPDALATKVQRLVRLEMENDPTKIIGRTDLVNNVVGTSVYTNGQVNPIVSDLLKRGELRYTGEASTQ